MADCIRVTASGRKLRLPGRFRSPPPAATYSVPSSTKRLRENSDPSDDDSHSDDDAQLPINVGTPKKEIEDIFREMDAGTHRHKYEVKWKGLSTTENSLVTAHDLPARVKRFRFSV